METIKKAVDSTKKFVYKHRVAIAVTLTTAICLKLNQVALADHDDFLRDNDLYEKFYTPSDEEMSA
jgi:hypothetical protein